MSARPRAPLPEALSVASRQFDQWRRRHRKRARLPKELWREAVALAREHGVYRTAQALSLRYGSLKKHVAETAVEQPVLAKTTPEFIEFLPSVMPSSSVECTIEWADNSGETMRMHLKGASLPELASLASVLRGSRA